MSPYDLLFLLFLVFIIPFFIWLCGRVTNPRKTFLHDRKCVGCNKIIQDIFPNVFIEVHKPNFICFNCARKCFDAGLKLYLKEDKKTVRSKGDNS